MNKDETKRIRAYHTGALLWLTDYLVLLPVYLLMKRHMSSFTLTYLDDKRKEIEADFKHGATFITNHRDIICDPAFFCFNMRLKYGIRPYMGIGNNLFKKWWIEPVVRYNRCYVVIRDGSPRDALQHATVLSEYIQHLRHRHKSIWIAQREGRAKDSNDLTQPAVLKMLTLADGNDFLSAVRKLNIMPVSLSYEYDPCDYLKAKEAQQRRDNPAFKKGPKDDLLSMKTGMWGEKGRVVFRMTPSINHWLDRHEEELRQLSRNEQIAAVAHQIDHQIHLGYEIYDRGPAFEQYLQGQLAKIDMPDRDDAFLLDKLHEMYNNPVINYEKSHLSGVL